jgi:hypothetical protein
MINNTTTSLLIKTNLNEFKENKQFMDYFYLAPFATIDCYDRDFSGWVYEQTLKRNVAWYLT